VKEAGGMLMLVLHFFPLIQGEVAMLKSERKQKGSGVMSGFRGWVENLEPLLNRLFDRADQLAKDIVSGTQSLETTNNQDNLALDRSSLLMSFLGLLTVLALWRV
jgi:energy-coupling factor transport system permease protein